MINLLEKFSLAHTQVTRLNADLREIVPANQTFSAKVELNLTPLEMEYEGELPQYQVTARMVCRGSRDTDSTEDQPLFTVELVVQAVYTQFRGDPVDFETFKSNHGSLTRQLYPVIHHQVQPVFKQFGLDQVKLPYDLAGNGQEQVAAGQRQVH
jgi:hypothetical protein